MFPLMSAAITAMFLRIEALKISFMESYYAVTFQRSNVYWNYKTIWVALKSLISIYRISNITDLL